MLYFMSNDEPQQCKYNIAEVNPSLWPRLHTPLQGEIDHTETCVHEVIPNVT